MKNNFLMLSRPPLKSLIIVLIISAIAPAATKANQRATKPRPATLRRAEVVANRIVQRFHHTLDFSGIFADEFVTEPGLRLRGVSFGDTEHLKGFDVATRERVFVALMTDFHLCAEYMLVQKDNEIPSEVEKLRSNTKLLLIDSTREPGTLQELNQGIRDFEKISALYRKYLSAAIFRGHVYIENIRSERERAKVIFHNVPRIERGNRQFGIPENVPVYVVRPEVFDYYFIEEKGVMKLFYVNILSNFKLF